MKRALKLWRTDGTKILGILQGTIAALAGVTGIIPERHLKYWLAASSVLTVWRGFVNSSTPPPGAVVPTVNP